MEEEKCSYYDISRSQRKAEVSRGLGHEGTIGYEVQGCYSCDGISNRCTSYIHSHTRVTLDNKLEDEDENV